MDQSNALATQGLDLTRWLENKLGNADDLWSSRNVCSHLTREILSEIPSCFVDLQSHTKTKLLMSILHLSRRNLEQWRECLEDITCLALQDTDDWVQMVAHFVRSFPTTNSLNLDVDDQDCESHFSRTFDELRKSMKGSMKESPCCSQLLPLEATYMNKAALTSTYGASQISEKHFALKRKSKAAALRNDLTSKALDVLNHVKTKGPSVLSSVLPIKQRTGKREENTAPLKGLAQNHFKTSGGFTATNSFNRPAATVMRKEGGIKLLDIGDMPLPKPKSSKQPSKKSAASKDKAGGCAAPDTDPGGSGPASVGDLESALSPEPVSIPGPDDSCGATAPTPTSSIKRKRRQSTKLSELELNSPETAIGEKSPPPSAGKRRMKSSHDDHGSMCRKLSGDEGPTASDDGKFDDVVGSVLSTLSNEQVGKPHVTDLGTLGESSSEDQAAVQSLSSLESPFSPCAFTPAESLASSAKSVNLSVETPVTPQPLPSLKTQQQHPSILLSATDKTPIISNNFDSTRGPTSAFVLPQIPLGGVFLSSNAVAELGGGLVVRPTAINAAVPRTTTAFAFPVTIGGLQSSPFAPPAAHCSPQTPQLTTTAFLQPQGQEPPVKMHSLLVGATASTSGQSIKPSAPAATQHAQPQQLVIPKEVMTEAQELFRTANKLSRPEKALILGFMAGSRDNPCPHVGEVLTLKLGERQEQRKSADGDKNVCFLVEEFFQMNYGSGTWKKFAKERTVE